MSFGDKGTGSRGTWALFVGMQCSSWMNLRSHSGKILSYICLHKSTETWRQHCGVDTEAGGEDPLRSHGASFLGTVGGQLGFSPCAGDSGGLAELLGGLVEALGVGLRDSARKGDARVCSALRYGRTGDVCLARGEPVPLGCFSGLCRVAEGLSTGILCDHTSGKRAFSLNFICNYVLR